MADPARVPAGPRGARSARQRKLMIYGAVAAAMVLVLLMRRGGSSSSSGSTSDPNAGQLTPVSNPAVDTGSYGSGVGPDYSGQLADFESQLTTVIGQAVANGMAAQPAPGSVPPGDILGPLPAAPGLLPIANGTGQQVGGSSASPSSPAPTGAARPHPTLHQRVGGAETAHIQMYRSPQSHAVLAQRASAHPGWGPHTIAAGHKLKGHSTRF